MIRYSDMTDAQLTDHLDSLGQYARIYVYIKLKNLMKQGNDTEHQRVKFCWTEVKRRRMLQKMADLS